MEAVGIVDSVEALHVDVLLRAEGVDVRCNEAEGSGLGGCAVGSGHRLGEDGNVIVG